MPISSAKTAFVFVYERFNLLGCHLVDISCNNSERLKISKQINCSAKRPALAITSSPDSRMFRSAIVTAAIPDEHATAPTPFSMEAILFSKDVTVGLPIRVGVAGSSVVEHLFKLFGRAVRKCTDLINGS